MKKKLNVIFIGQFLYPNGFAATKRKQQFLECILNKGDTVRVLLTLKLAKGHELNDLKGVYKGVPYEVTGANVKANILLPFTYILFISKTLHKILKYKEKEQKNIVVAFSINFDTVFPLLFAKLIGYKIVFDIVEDFSTLTNKGTYQKIKNFIRTSLLKNLIKYLASGISVITSYLKNKYAQKIKKNIPIELAPISASNIDFPFEKKEKINNEFTLLYSGTYGTKEGLPFLLEAFYEVSQKWHNVKLVLTGNCPDAIKNNIFDKFGDFSKFIFTGRLEDEDYYKELINADILLMTRNNSGFANAGFPYKLGEYLATGNPVIASKVSDVEIYLKDKIDAYLVEPENKKILFETIEYILSNYDIAKKTGINGKNVCKKHFNPDINSNIFYSLLENC